MNSSRPDSDTKFFEDVLNRLEKLNVDPNDFENQKKRYASFLRKFQGKHHVDDIFSLLSSMINIKLYPNAYIINNMISKLKKYYPYTKRIFVDADKKMATSNSSYNAIIKAAINNEDIKFAKQIFDKAEEFSLVEVRTLNNIIHTFGKTKNQEDYSYIRTKFNNALKKEKDVKGNPFIDTIMMTTMINVAVLNNQLNDVKDYCELAEKKDLLIYTASNMVIDVFGKTGNAEDYLYTKQRFEYALKKKVDPALFTTMINVAVLNKELNDVKDYCDLAKKRSLLTCEITTMVIDTLGKAGKTKDYHYAKQMFQYILKEKVDAEGKPFFESMLFNAMINVAIFNDELDDVKMHYHLCEEKKLVNIDSINILMDGYVRTGRQDYFDLAKQKSCELLILKINSNHFILDLHYYTYNSAYLSLKYFIESHPLPLNLTIIYGKGEHSMNLRQGEDNPVKKATLKLMDALKKDNYEIDDTKKTKDTGSAIFKISAAPKKQLKRARENDTAIEPENKRQKISNEVLMTIPQGRQLIALRYVREQRQTSPLQRLSFWTGIMTQIAKDNTPVIDDVIKLAAKKN